MYMSKSYLVHYISNINYTSFVFQNANDESDSIEFGYTSDKTDYKEFAKFINKCRSEQTVLIGFQMIDVITQVFRAIVSQKPYSIFQLINSIEDKYYNEEQPMFVNDPASSKIWNVYDLCRIKKFNRIKLEELKCIRNFPNVANHISIEEKKSLTEHDIMTFTIALMKDLKFIKQLWEESIIDVKFISALGKKYSIDFRNNTENGIIKRIAVHQIASKSGENAHDLLHKKTHINFMKCEKLFNKKYGFKTKEMKYIQQFMGSLSIDKDIISFTEKINYNGIVISYSKNGLSASRPGIYNTNKHQSIISIDVKNFFATIVLNGKYAPQHLNRAAFLQTMNEFVSIRNKEGIQEIQKKFFKSAIVTLIGLTNTNSFCKDVSFYMRTTINGMMMMSQLIETIIENAIGTKLLRIQIDGIEIAVPKEQEDNLKKVLKWFKESSNVNLTIEKYKSLIITSAKDYTALKMPVEYLPEKNYGIGYIKEMNDKKYFFEVSSKGLYKEDESENGSFKIIPKVIKDFFFNGIQPEDAIMKYTNIFDFIGYVTCKSHYGFSVGESDVYETLLRYYKIKGDAEGKTKIKRKNIHGTYAKIDTKGYECIAAIVNPTAPIDIYDLDYDFYLDKIKLEISKIQRNDTKD